LFSEPLVETTKIPIEIMLEIIIHFITFAVWLDFDD